MAGSSFCECGTRSPTLLEFTLVVALRHREERSDPFMTYLCKICFKKPSISFPATYPTAHDRFLCIDDTVYHIGASLKDLGKKWFAFSMMEIGAKALWEKCEGLRFLLGIMGKLQGKCLFLQVKGLGILHLDFDAGYWGHLKKFINKCLIEK